MTKLTAGPPAVRLDAAIERALEPPSVDRNTRIQLERMRGVLFDAFQPSTDITFNGPNLTDVLLAFVMPHLRHPEVLQAEHHQTLLERLAVELVGPDDVVCEGVSVVHRELRQLAHLRQNRNSLVES